MKHRKAGLITLAGASAACALGLLAGPAQGTGTSFTGHQTFPAGPGTFTCTQGNLDITGGTISIVFHENQDSAGIFHVTGTLTPHGVTLRDTAGHTYTISGANWFGGKSTDPDGNVIIEGGDTEHFVIRSASGGVFAKVQSIEHISPNGVSFSFDRGSCQTPQH